MKALEFEVEFSATPVRIWETITSPVLIAQWLHDAPCKIHFEGRVGGAIVVEGELHGLPFTNKGEVIAWQPSDRLAYTYWTSITGTPDRRDHHFEIEFSLVASGHGTTLVTLRQQNVPEGTLANHWNLYWPPTLTLIGQIAAR